MEKKESLAAELRREFYRDNRLYFGAALAATVVLAFVNLYVSYLMQVIIDIVSGASGGATLLQVTLQVGATVLVLILAMLADLRFSPLFMKRAMAQYKEYAFREITRKSIHSFQAENSSTYISAFSNDIASIETNYLGKIFSLVMSVIMFIGAFAMMLWYHPLLTFIAVALSAFPVLAAILTGNRMAKAELAVSRENAGFLDMLKDILGGFSVIKSFRVEKEIIANFIQKSESTEEAKRKRRMIGILIGLIGAVAGIVAQIGVFLAGAYLALSGRGVTAGVVIVFVQLMNFVIQPISQVPQILAGRKAANALIDKLAEAIAANTRDGGESLDPVLDQGIALESVSFAYEKDQPVLRDVSWTFERGRSYAVVGASGSGKSTLLNLLMGSSSAYTGSIRIDERELAEASTDSLYELVSIIQQNVFIFNDSIRANITMYHDFAQADIEEAAAMAGLSELIADKGWDYPCGENGSGLSGGERQRVSIARCLLRETPVLLIDEATAALDPRTAHDVTHSILDLKDLLRIMVTHHLDEGILRRFDQILVMRHGILAEAGSFTELMAGKGYFYSLFNVAQDRSEETNRQSA